MSLAQISSLVLVGAGKMGGAMLEGWLRGGLAGSAVTVIDPQAGDEITALAKSHELTLNPELEKISAPQLVVIAIKPQMMAAVLPSFAGIAAQGSTFISVAAGQTIADMERNLGGPAQIVRVMPNTPAAVGAGISVLVANDATPDDMRGHAETLMRAVGMVRWIDDEALMDAVTAVSGSGPAYVFHLVEAMAAAGVAAGLAPELSMDLARQTVIGGGALMAASLLPAATLRENVTSPAGTTAAALDVLMADDGLPPLMVRAVAAAKKRGQELGG